MTKQHLELAIYLKVNRICIQSLYKARKYLTYFRVMWGKMLQSKDQTLCGTNRHVSGVWILLHVIVLSSPQNRMEIRISNICNKHYCHFHTKHLKKNNNTDPKKKKKEKSPILQKMGSKYSRPFENLLLCHAWF